MSTTYRTVLSFDQIIEAEDGSKSANTIFLPFDLVTNRSINESSNIVTQPLLNGTNASDHSYRNPTTISLNGKFSLYGLYAEDDSYNFINKDDDTKSRLENIEDTFKYLKNNGILCTIYFLGYDDEPMSINMLKDRNMFSVRESFAVESFTFNQNLAAMDFSINFKEVIIVDDTSYGTYTGSDDPTIEPYKIASYTSYLANLSDDALGSIIIRALYDSGFIEDSWIKVAWENYGKGLGTGTLIAGIITTIFTLKGGAVILQSLGTLLLAKSMASIASAVAGGGAVAATGLSLATALGIAVAVVVAIVAVGAWIYAIVKANKAMKKKKKAKCYIKLVSGSTTDGEAKLTSLIMDVRNALRQASTDIRVITFPEDTDNSVGLINLEGIYYQISVSPNTNVSDEAPWKNYFHWEVERCSKNNDGFNFIQNIDPPVMYDFESMTWMNAWFRDEVNNKSFLWVYNSDSSIEKLIPEIDALKEKILTRRRAVNDEWKSLYPYNGDKAGLWFTDEELQDFSISYETMEEGPASRYTKADVNRYKEYETKQAELDALLEYASYKMLSSYLLVICSDDMSKEFKKVEKVITEALGL